MIPTFTCFIYLLQLDTKAIHYVNVFSTNMSVKILLVQIET